MLLCGFVVLVVVVLVVLVVVLLVVFVVVLVFVVVVVLFVVLVVVLDVVLDVVLSCCYVRCTCCSLAQASPAPGLGFLSGWTCDAWMANAQSIWPY